MNRLYLSAILIEIIGIITTSIGIGFELTYREPVGFVTITLGSVIVASGSLIYAKVYKKNK